MSSIDSYPYKCLGEIECPCTDSWFGVKDWVGPLHIAIYRLNQDIPPDEQDFQGKKGDILLGGGSGEAPTLRISIPEAFRIHTHDVSKWDDDYDYTFRDITTQIVAKAYWTLTDAYKFCEGYRKIGWTTNELIEVWLTQHILSFVAKRYPNDYSKFVGPQPLNYDGSICRLLTPEEDRIWNWQDYLTQDPHSLNDQNSRDKLIYQPIPKHQSRKP